VAGAVEVAVIAEALLILRCAFAFAVDGAEDAGAVVADADADVDALAGAVEVAVVVTVEFNADMGQ
jgi:hypothetical protein